MTAPTAHTITAMPGCRAAGPSLEHDLTGGSCHAAGDSGDDHSTEIDQGPGVQKQSLAELIMRLPNHGKAVSGGGT